MLLRWSHVPKWEVVLLTQCVPELFSCNKKQHGRYKKDCRNFVPFCSNSTLSKNT